MKNKLDEITDGRSIIAKKGALFIYNIDERMKSSLDYLENHYSRKDLLNKALSFVDYNLSDAVRTENLLLFKVGFYPITEAQFEINNAVQHAIIGSYKAAFADLRRALELVLLMVYLSLDEITLEEAQKWHDAKINTPMRIKLMKTLIKQYPFKQINDELGWHNNVDEIYYDLSDRCHNRGTKSGYREMSNISSYFGSSPFPSIKNETLHEFADLLISTVQEIISIVALYNPLVLVGLPLEEKFGFNGPASGYFLDGQSEKLHELIPQKYQPFFNTLKENDEHVQGTIKWFKNMTDVTEEEIKRQVEDFNNLFSSGNNDQNTD